MKWLSILLITTTLHSIAQIQPNPAPSVLDGVYVPDHIPTKCKIPWDYFRDCATWNEPFTIKDVENPINMDSIKLLLTRSNKFRKVSDSIPYMDEHFSRYINLDSSVRIDVNFNENYEYCEYIELAMVYRKYDKNNKLLARIGYNKNGRLYLWDFDPVEIYHYWFKNAKCYSFNHKKELLYSNITRYDSLERIISKEYFDNENKPSSMTTYEYNDLTNEEIKKEYDGNNNLSSKYDCAIIFKKYNVDRSLVIEEQYFDENNQLYDGTHNQLFTSNDKFSIIRRSNLENGTRVQYFNSNGDIVYEIVHDN